MGAAMSATNLYKRSRAVLALLVTLIVSAPAHAAIDIRLGTSAQPDVVIVELSGAFARGDAQRVQAFLATLPADRQIAISLNSTGGIVDEALRIGRHLHANRIGTHVTGAGRHCLSACALAFLGGRALDGAALRVKSRDARIGFHGFRRVVADKEFTIADMHEAIASTQHALLAIADYLLAVDADIEFMSLMLDQPASSMSWLANDRAAALGVRVVP